MGSHRAIRRNPIRTAALSLAALAGFPLAAGAGIVSVEEIVLVAGRDMDAGQWFFLVEVAGTNLTSVGVQPPSGGPIVLDDASEPGSLFSYERGSFATFDDLQSMHPSGSYTFTVNGSHTVTLAWSPTEIVGAAGEPSLVIDSPADGAVGVSSMPDIAFTLDCENCDDLNLELDNPFGMAGTFDFGELDVVSFTNPIPFAAMTNESGATELEPGLAEAELLSGLATFTGESFDPPSSLGSFAYIEAAVVVGRSIFTVPEPSAATSAAVALAALALLGRLAQRSTTTR